jgi:uncharacterized membrane protein YfcA
MEILGYIAAVLIGLSLGMVGSGGSILTVPVLVYLMGVNPLLATTSSLFIVGITSLVGGIRAYSKKQVDFKTVTEFGIPSIFSIFITRHFLLPALPEVIFHSGDFVLSKETFLMVVFAALMLAAAVSMIKKADAPAQTPGTSKTLINNTLLLILLGLVIGVVTGMLGAGGGFLIIPVLVLVLGLPIKKAIGTSLMLIAINTLFGFLFSVKQFIFDWKLLIIFSLLAIGGLFAGAAIADRISSGRLKKYFGWFVLLMGMYIILRELILK